MFNDEFKVTAASSEHKQFAQEICDEMFESAKARGTGIARRTQNIYLRKWTREKL